MSNSTANTQFKRLNFFTGFFTTADDWSEGQKYHLEKRKLHLRGLHTPGIIDLPGQSKKSFTVTAINQADGASDDNDWCVLISPGAALDGEGNLIYLPETKPLDLKQLATCMKPLVKIGSEPIFLAIRYHECETDYSANAQDPDYSGHRRVTEKIKFAIFTAEPTDGKWLELARIQLAENATQITQGAINCHHVKKAGVVDPNRDAETEEIKDNLELAKEALRQRIYRTHRYHLEKEQRHNRGIHTPGILRGVGDCFNVDAIGGSTIRIEPGAAIDSEGQEIFLATAVCKTLDRTKTPCGFYVGVRYLDEFEGYLQKLNPEDEGNYSSAEIVISQDAPDDEVVIKIAHIHLRADTEDIAQDDIDTSGLRWSGSVTLKAGGLSEALCERIRSLLVTTRETMAELAFRFPSPAVNDVRATVLGFQLSLDILNEEQLPSRIATLAAVEQAVCQELGEHYPPLPRQAEFKAYCQAVNELGEAVQQHEPVDILLNYQHKVANAASSLAKVVLEPPTADAGPDQFHKTMEPVVDVTLDAGGSSAAEGHHLVQYRWENLTTRTVITKTDQAQVTVPLPIGVHVLRLVVEDDAHLRSEPDIVVITIELSEITISHIDPSTGWRGATVDAVITGNNLHHATAVKIYRDGIEDERVRASIQSGNDHEHLPICLRISKLALLGERILEVITPLGSATVSFTVVPHELPTILAIEPVWGMPGSIHPLPTRIEGDHFEQANAATFLYGAKPDPDIRTIIRHATPDYLNVDLTISANAEFGRRRFTVTTPAGTTESPPTVTFTVMPGFLQVAIMLLTLITAVVHLTLHFPNTLFILNGLGYLTLLAGLYLPTRWLFVGLRPWMRWALLAYALLTIVSWIAIGDRTTLAYMTKAVEAALAVLLLIESRQP